jgi:hypothetical protein
MECVDDNREDLLVPAFKRVAAFHARADRIRLHRRGQNRVNSVVL